jgi:stage IV sporulation protein FB
LGRVEATGDFLLLMAWLNYLDRQGIVPMAMAACLLHELGHWAVIRLLGGQISLVRLTAVGAEMVLRCPMGYWQEGVSALAGPGVNLLLALIFCAWPGGAVFAGLNLVLACFNMLPAGRLDGGRALYCTLALLAAPEWAGRIGRCLDGIWAAVLLVCGALLARFGGNITLLLVSLWLLTAALPEKYWDQNRNRTCHRRRKKVQ